MERLRAELAQAEQELRRLRQQRIKLDGLTTGPRPAPEFDETSSGAPVGKATDVPLPPLTDDLVEAVVGYEDPPPGVAQRLAECLCLLAKAPVLVDLGDMPFPKAVPWQNMKLLLQRSWADRPKVQDLQAALARDPHGKRLRDHVRAEALRGLTRAEVEAFDGSCLPAFDLVAGLLGVAPAGAAPAPAPASAPAPPVNQEEEAAREGLLAAVADQEREVARLRRQLGDADRSEHAARKFAEANDPARAQEARQAKAEAKAEAETAMLEAAKAKAEEREAVRAEQAQREAAVQAASEKTAAAVAQSRVMENPELNDCRKLEYRLNETGVPPLQESVLVSLLKLLVDQRTNTIRHLKVRSFAEVREEPEVAQQRAEAVREWLLANGIPGELLHLETVTEAPRGSRRSELHLLGEQGGSEAVRQKAEDLLERIMHPDVPCAADDIRRSMGQPAHTGRLSSSGRNESSGAPRLASLEELPADSDSARQSVRLAFDLHGVEATDIDLEAGDTSVRLSSLSGAWPEVLTQLPFAVQPPDARGARFSKRAGTLTVKLVAAA